MGFGTQRIGRAVLELSIDGGAFVRGAGDAKAVVRDLGRNIAQTQRDIQKQAFSFSGRQQIADAAKLSSAIERVGGVSRLTAAEKAKVNAQLKEAIEKYRVIGQQAPAAMIATEKATRGAGNATQWMQGKMVALGAAVGTFAGNIALRAVSGLAAMGREAFTSAGRILDLSNKTGLGTRTIQEMQFVAEQTGGSLDGFTNAAFQLGVRIDENSTQVRQAVDELRKYGVETDRLRNARPDEQWNLVTTALSKVENVQERNRLGMALMGRTFRDVSASIQEGYRGIADQAAIATNAQLKELDRLNDEWQKFLRNLTTGFGAAMGNAVIVARQMRQMSIAELAKAAALGSLAGDPMGGIAARARVNEEAARRRTTDISLPAPVLEPLTDFIEELKAAQAELKNLDAAERAQIAAAQRLGDVTEEQLTQTLVRFGVSASRAGAVLKLLSGEAKESGKTANTAAKDWQNFIEQWTDASKRATAVDLAKAIATRQIELSKLTKEQQQAIMKALQDGADAWRAWANVVPAQVAKALSSVEMLRLMREELEALHRVPAGAALPEGDRDRAQADVDRGFEGQDPRAAAQTRLDAERTFSASMRDLAIDRTEFAIKQAERAGASRIELLQMEETVAHRKEAAEREDALRTFEQATRTNRQLTLEEQAEFTQREMELDAHLARVNEKYRQASEERQAEMRRETDFWLSELGRRISAELRGAQHELTGRVVSTLFSGGDDSRRREAEAARDHYERIRKSGTASAEEITRAYMAMRDAQNRAGSQWADRFKSIFDGVKRHIFGIFDAILERFLNKLLKGMIDGLLGANFTQRLGNWLGNLIGGGSGGGGLPGQAAQWGLGQLLGGGGIATTAFSTTAGGTLAASMFAPSVASAAVPAAIASQGASAAVYGAAAGSAAAGSAAAGGGAAAASGAAAGGGASAMGFLANPAFWTNPWTIAAIGGAIAAPWIIKGLKAVFGGGPSDWDRIRKARELTQRGVPQSKWPDWITSDASTMRRVREGRLFDPVTLNAFGFQLGPEGSGQRFHTGGVVGTGRSSIGMPPPRPGASFTNRLNSNEVNATLLKGEGVLTPRATAMIGGKAAIDALNAGAFRNRLNLQAPRIAIPEIRIPQMARASLSMPAPSGGGRAALPAVTTHQVTFNVSTPDAAGFAELWDGKIMPALKRELTFDRSGLIPSLKNAVLR